MANLNWTERSTADFVYKISFDFVLQLESKMNGEISQKQLAEKLGVSVGRVSQVMNNPGNLTLRKIVEYSRALGLKVAIVAYDDGDSQNQNGPVNSEIFAKCWSMCGRPTDFFFLAEPTTITQTTTTSFLSWSDYIAGMTNSYVLQGGIASTSPSHGWRENSSNWNAEFGNQGQSLVSGSIPPRQFFGESAHGTTKLMEVRP